MSILPAAWSHVLTTPEHTYVFLALVGLAGAVAFLSLTGTILQRIISALPVLVAVAALSPLLVSPAYLSDGVWTWGLGLLGSTSMVAAALTYATRAALGCVLTSRIEWSLWVVAVGSTWVALTLAGAFLWAIPFALSVVALFVAGTLLPAHLASSPGRDELLKASVLLSLPVALTGVTWAAVPPLLVAAACAGLGQWKTSQDSRLMFGRSSVVTSHAIAGVLPLTLLALGAPALSAA